MRRFLKRSTNKRPPDTDFAQMRLKAWPPAIKPLYIAIALIILGVLFLPTGTKLRQQSDDVVELNLTYDDGTASSFCYISTSNQQRVCQATFTFPKDATGPVYLYYTLENFFQNHRRYYQSRSIFQLQGEALDQGDVELPCTPLYKNGSQLLNPCGLVANSFFTDMFSINTALSTYSDLSLDETDIALPSDKTTMFNQVDGFQYTNVSSPLVSCTAAGLPSDCKDYLDTDTGTLYKYYYPKDDSVQYLHETYPDQISPIDGVTDEHFIVWMRTAMFPTFRKLYGKIHHDFKKGDALTITITANYEVGSFDASKGLLLSTLGDYGGRNKFPAEVFLTVGSFALIGGCLLLMREIKNIYF